jgi:hypothetical protein
MPVRLKGFDKQYRKLKNAVPELNKKVPVVLGKYGSLMVKYARANHKFNTQTGQLERSITHKVDRKNWTLEFFIDDVRVYSNGYNYGLIQHDGSGARYKRSRFSPTVSPKLKTGGVKSDHFMVRAWDQYVDKMTDELQEILIKALT